MTNSVFLADFGDPRLPTRFWDKVNKNGPIPAHRPELGPCWVWTGARTGRGYGQFNIGSRTDDSRRHVMAHRFAYELLIVAIPEELESDHLCRNRPCIRPFHIEPVTHIMNGQRGIQPKGETNGAAKLKAADIPVIRALRGKISQSKIARWFGVRQWTISAIQLGKRWSHV